MEIFIIIIIVIICYNIFEYFYFKSQKFIQIKNSIKEHILNCNELNEHIEELKNAYIDIKQIDYGQADYKDYSNYNYKRPELKKIREKQNVYNCSLQICKNAQKQPFKYLCKYFNIKPDEETLSNFESVFNDFSAAEQGKILLKDERDKIVENISERIPFFIRNFRKNKLYRKLGFEDIDFSQLYFPKYSFDYVSAGGNSSMKCDIVLDIENMERFINYLSELVKLKKSVAGQRALMTSALREKIKKRDNYTCQCCGISIEQEPHLLLEIDHIIPLSKAGVTTEDNLQTLCWKCNRTKGCKVSNNSISINNNEHNVNFKQDNSKILEIKRLFEIIYESQDLVNKSSNIEVVKERFDLLLNKIKQVMEYSEEELNKAGYTKLTLQQQYDSIEQKYDVVINQAIERAFEKEKIMQNF